MAQDADTATDKKIKRSRAKKERTGYDNLVKIGKYYYVDFYKEGRGHLQRSTGETSIAKAKEIRTQLINEFLGKKETKKLFHQALIADLSVPHLEQKKREDRESTFESRSEKFRLHLLPYFGQNTPYEIEDRWEGFIDYMKAKDVGISQSRKHMFTFLSWCVKKGHLDKLPDLRNPDPQAEEGRVYTPKEMKSIFEFAHTEGPDFELLVLMSSTMYTRASENNVLWDRVKLQLDPPQFHLKSEDTKTKKARKFAISSECLPRLIERKSHAKSPAIFPHPDNAQEKQYREWYDKPWERVKERAGITGRARFHDIRHTAITYAVKRWPHMFVFICNAAGLDLRVAEKTYLHLTPKDTAVIMSPMGSLEI